MKALCGALRGTTRLAFAFTAFAPY